MTILRQGLMDREDQFEYKAQSLDWAEKNVTEAEKALEKAVATLEYEKACLAWTNSKFDLIQSTLHLSSLSYEECKRLEATLPPYPVKP